MILFGRPLGHFIVVHKTQRRQPKENSGWLQLTKFPAPCLINDSAVHINERFYIDHTAVIEHFTVFSVQKWLCSSCRVE